MGIGNTAVAAALSLPCSGGTLRPGSGRGAGVDDAGLTRKIDAVRRALDLHLSQH